MSKILALKNLTKEPLRNLYKSYRKAVKANKETPLAVINFTEGVMALSPTCFDVLRLVRWAKSCVEHRNSIYTHVAFCFSFGCFGDYTDKFGPGIYLGKYAGKNRGIIFGHMNEETQNAFVAEPGGKAILPCGCVLERISDEEVSSLIDDKLWTCGYINHHLVDDRSNES